MISYADHKSLEIIKNSKKILEIECNSDQNFIESSQNYFLLKGYKFGYINIS